VPAPKPQDPKDGAELASHFLARSPGMRVVLCSASDPSDARLRSLLDAGKAEFVMKPVLAAQLREVLVRLAGSAPAGSRR
jgi:DNA-binding NarL/FixJ family response regulator